MKRSIAATLLFTCSLSVVLAQKKMPTTAPAKPKLIIGLVIDQMRWDYLYRYNNLYIDDGFKRLLREGFACENTMIPYTPTYTAPGHTCIYTGSVPAIHGIVGNHWYNRKTGKTVYCTDDEAVQSVGTANEQGKMSTTNMWATTITDELRLANNFKSKVIGIALKDRGAILPAGHSANAAYWYDDKNGKWISSTQYMDVLPGWVHSFNSKMLPDTYMAGEWTTLLPANKYTQSTADYQVYEGNIKGDTSVVFPHKLNKVAAKYKYEAFKTTPFATSFTFDFAKTAIENEALGSNTETDFLAISISSTDYIGHAFGPNSIEAQDAFLRLDKDVAAFLQYLDTKIGKGNYLLFLTADHGAAHVPKFLKGNNIPAGEKDDAEIEKMLNQKVEAKLGIANAVARVMNYQVYLGDAASEKREEIVKYIITELKSMDSVIADAVELDELAEATLPEPIKTRIINGYNPHRSGDIQFIYKPGYFDGWGKGTTHGVWNPYDAHIPLLWFGWGVKAGKLYRETYMTDIAPTLAAMLQVQMPNGCVGQVIPELIK